MNRPRIREQGGERAAGERDLCPSSRSKNCRTKNTTVGIHHEAESQAVHGRLGLGASGARQRKEKPHALLDEAVGPGTGDHANIAEGAGLVGRFRARFLQDGRLVPAHLAVNPGHLLDCRLPSAPLEGLAKLCEHAGDLSFMNLRIRAIQVAERFLHAVAVGLEHVPAFFLLVFLLRHCQAQLERHVEPGRAGLLAVQFHAGKIVDGVFTISNQFQNLVQAARTIWNFECCPRDQAKSAHTCNVGDEQPLKLLVVGNVQENFSARLFSFCHAFASFG